MKLLRTLSTVSGMTLLSRITGLVRESLKAAAFGAGMQMDAFEAAFRLPNILRRLFAEGAFSQAFVPIFAEYRRQRGDTETKALMGRVGSLLAVALLAISIIGVLAAPWLVYLLASGFQDTPGKVDLTAQMIRIVFPYILFVSLVSLAGGVLNVYRRFAIPAFTPVLLNLSIIGAALFLAPYCHPPITALAWGVLIGGVAQLALQIRPLIAIGMLPRPRFDWRDEGVRRVLLAMGPAVIGVSAAQISALINTQLAASLGDGRISWITYADRLMEFPSALLGVALGTVLLPTLAKHHADENPAEYSSLLDWGLRLAFLLALPAAVALWVLATPLIATLYQYGKFTVNDVLQTRDALLGYSVGLLGLILVKILAPGFYARLDMKTPVKIAFVTVVFAQTLAWILMHRIGHAGLTLSTSLGACLNAALLFWFLRRRGVYRPRAGWLQFVSRQAVALWVLATPLIATLYQYGKFTVNDVLQTRDALLGYSVGLLGLILVKILAPGFYARLDMKTPVKIAFVTVVFAQTLAWILMHRIGHAGLTLSTSLGACLNAGLLFWFLRRRGVYRPRAGWLQFVSRQAVALFVLAAVLLWIVGPSTVWLNATLWAKVGRLAWVCAAGAAAYFGALWLLGFRLSDFDRRETEIDPAAGVDPGDE